MSTSPWRRPYLSVPCYLPSGDWQPMKTALITGITGQDGSYLAELLLAEGYEVHGLVRPTSTLGTARIAHLAEASVESASRLQLHYGDLSDGSQLSRLLGEIRPNEIYNLAAQSHVMISFEQPEYTGDITGLGVTRLLEATRHVGGESRLYHASSSEMFGDAPAPQSELTEFRPRSPYAIAKLYAHLMVKNYREAYGIFAVSGILFNHEGERRGETFVTRKITRSVARILAGLQEKLFLGNLDASRDWGHARDYVRAIYLMLQQADPRDYCIGTGKAHTVREFCELAFDHVGLDWERFVEVDPKYFRPTEVEHLVADSTRARAELGWKPEVSFEELVKGMVESDLHDFGFSLPDACERGVALQRKGA